MIHQETKIVHGQLLPNGTTVASDTPYLDVTALRTSPSYIRGYLMWTRLFSTGLIPVTILLFLNVRIINDIFSSSQKVQR